MTESWLGRDVQAMVPLSQVKRMPGGSEPMQGGSDTDWNSSSFNSQAKWTSDNAGGDNSDAGRRRLSEDYSYDDDYSGHDVDDEYDDYRDYMDDDDFDRSDYRKNRYRGSQGN